MMRTIPSLQLVGEWWSDVEVRTGRYADGSLALTLELPDGERLTTASVRASDLPTPGLHQFYVRDYSENIGLGDQMARAGVVTILGGAVTGPFDSPVLLVELTPEWR